MALFTENEACCCSIARCDSFKTDGVHDYWVFRVVDENGESYEWKDETLPGSADGVALRDKIYNHLLTIEKKAAAPVKSVDSDAITGEPVGVGSPLAPPPAP